jgi:hypothetical protein
MNKNTYISDLCIKYDDKFRIQNVLDCLLMNFILENTYWEYSMSKLSSACYVMGSVKPCVSQNILKMIYFSFHSVTTYGLVFWGHSPDSVKIFMLQKKIIRIILGCRSRESCRELLMKLKILPVPSQYILSLLFVIKNKKQYTSNFEVYHIGKRQHLNLH